jgi:hypothetical protein
MTKDEIIEMARQAGFVDYELDDGTTNAFDKRYEAFAKLVATKEREECAVICETYWNRPNNGMSTEEEVYGSVTAELIRARGQE